MFPEFIEFHYYLSTKHVRAFNSLKVLPPRFELGLEPPQGSVLSRLDYGSHYRYINKLLNLKEKSIIVKRVIA